MSVIADIMQIISFVAWIIPASSLSWTYFIKMDKFTVLLIVVFALGSVGLVCTTYLKARWWYEDMREDISNSIDSKLNALETKITKVMNDSSKVITESNNLNQSIFDNHKEEIARLKNRIDKL